MEISKEQWIESITRDGRIIVATQEFLKRDCGTEVVISDAEREAIHCDESQKITHLEPHIQIQILTIWNQCDQVKCVCEKIKEVNQIAKNL